VIIFESIDGPLYVASASVEYIGPVFTLDHKECRQLGLRSNAYWLILDTPENVERALADIGKSDIKEK